MELCHLEKQLLAWSVAAHCCSVAQCVTGSSLQCMVLYAVATSCPKNKTRKNLKQLHFVSVQVSSMEQEVACSAGNLMQHYEAVLSLVLGQGLTDADK